MDNQTFAHIYLRLLMVRPSGKRQITPDEIAYESAFSEAVNASLTALYEEGVSLLPQAPENASTSELEAFLYALLLISVPSQQLLLMLQEFLLDGFELGGEMALGDLGLDPDFELSNQGLIDQINSYAGELRNQLVLTTASDIAGQVEKHKENGISDWVLIGMLILSWAFTRAIVRAGWVAINEGVWATRFAAVETYRRNGVQQVMFLTQRDERVDDECWQYDGNIYPTNAIPPGVRPPIHIGCRCDLIPADPDWVSPTTIWRGN